ncbi:MAG: aldo/keto reductase [Phycisphaerales bacterium]|nr:aldo/keto reductase [Phycisphaerales bacterium]
MSTRVRLGKTNLQVSPICFGTWQLSPKFWGKADEEAISIAVRKAYEADVNFFDTAGAYGDGLAETVLGKAIKGLPREKLVIATKVHWHIRPDASRYADLSAEYIAEECEACLKRMGLDYMDLFQCHSWDPLGDFGEIAGTMDKLVKQGKIRAYGTSNWNAEQMRGGNQFGRFYSCQPKYSLLATDIEQDVLPYCLANDIGVLTYSTLHLGLLTGKFVGDETFSDLRKNNRDFSGERFKVLCDRIRQAGDLAKKYDLTITQLMLAATLMHPAVTCAIVGVKTGEQIVESAGAMGKKISRDDYGRLRALLSVS